MEKEEKKVKQNLMFDVTGYPEEKFTENGERYYYTRPDGTPITGSNWSLKDLAYPLNLIFGGKSPTDDSWELEEGSQEQLNAELSKHSFGSWLVNAAPTQLLPFLGGAKKFKQIQSNKKVMKDMKYKENVEDVTGFGDKQIGFRVDDYLNSVNNLSLVDKANIQKLKGIKNKGLLNPIFTAKELGLDPSGTTFYSMNEPNYGAIEGSDELTPNFLSQWQKRAKTGEKTYYFDISNHRILDVPGMDNIVNQTRYKQWLTQNLINRYNQASLYPDVDLKNPMNTDFYDSQDQVWRLVKADQNAVGPNQVYIPTPLSEIDSRKMKSENSSEADRVLLRELMKLNVSERNALEKKYPWLIDWNSDTSGQNYHEHMIGLDETEFWKSAYGRSLGYKNNDVYVLDKGLGNIVFLNDPKFKVMKDQLAEYVTPSKKREVFPGKKKRAFPVKKFTGNKYKGLNAVIGYEADIYSPNKSDLVIYAYDPSETKNIGFKTEYTIPNYYSFLYAKKKDGSALFPLEIREGILHTLIDSYLSGNPRDIIHLEDLTEDVFREYGINIDLQNPTALEELYPDFGVISSDSAVNTSADETIFKTTRKNEILQARAKKESIKNFLYRLDLYKNGRYKQLTLDLLFDD